MQDLLRLLFLFGLVTAVCGMLVFWYGFYCYFAAAFDAGPWWGISSLLLYPVLMVVLLIRQWPRVRASFATKIAGLLLVALGFVAMQIPYWST
jgi:hypothetical protein